MNKSKALENIKFVGVIAAVFGIVASILFGVLPMVKVVIEATKYTSEYVTTYSGFAMIFGGKPTVIANGSAIDSSLISKLGLNVTAFLGFLFVLLGSIFGVVIPFVKKLNKNKVYAIVAGALMVVGALLMFSVKGNAASVMAGENGDVDSIKDMLTLASGPIVAGILALVGGIANIAYPFLKK
jgi:hypothetical protein